MLLKVTKRLNKLKTQDLVMFIYTKIKNYEVHIFVKKKL